MGEQNNTTIISSGKQFTVKDTESGSKAFFPFLVDEEYRAEVIKVDNGILHNKQQNERACDYMLIVEGNQEKIVCLTELKGTDNNREVEHAFSQMNQTICRISNTFFENSDYVMAAIVGAQDKTLPRMISQEQRCLCKKMFAKSKKKIKNMEKLVFYVQPNNSVRKAFVNINKTPHVIECHSKNGAGVPIPSMLLKAIDCE